jgi:hypothetical protein
VIPSRTLNRASGSAWGRQGVMPDSCCCDASCSGVWEGGGGGRPVFRVRGKLGDWRPVGCLLTRFRRHDKMGREPPARTVHLPEAWREIDAAPSGDEWGSWAPG